MTHTTAYIIGFLGDVALCWASWRFFVGPRLRRLIRSIAREEIAHSGPRGAHEI